MTSKDHFPWRTMSRNSALFFYFYIITSIRNIKFYQLQAIHPIRLHYINKNEPRMGLTVAIERRRHLANAIAKPYTELRLFQVRSHVTKKLGHLSKIWSVQNLDIFHSFIESVVICQLTLKMSEEIDFENWRISNFKGLVTLTLDRVIRHTVVHHSSTSTYIPNFIGIGKTFCGRTDGHLRPTLLGQLFIADLIIGRTRHTRVNWTLLTSCFLQFSSFEFFLFFGDASAKSESSGDEVPCYACRRLRTSFVRLQVLCHVQGATNHYVTVMHRVESRAAQIND